MKRLLRCELVGLALGALAAGQVKIPVNNHYEAVAIKPGVRGEARCGVHFHPGEFWLDNCSLPPLIATLLGMPRNRIVGLPAWTSSETYSFRAKSVAPAKPMEQWGMLVPVLEDRFKLKYHREKRQMPVYLFSVESNGLKFPVAVPGSCAPIDDNVGAPPAVPDRSKGSARSVVPKPPDNCELVLAQQLPDGGVRLSIKAVTMAYFAGELQRYVDRPVVDRTGTREQFDVDLSFDARDLAVSETVSAAGAPDHLRRAEKSGAASYPRPGRR